MNRKDLENWADRKLESDTDSVGYYKLLPGGGYACVSVYKSLKKCVYIEKEKGKDAIIIGNVPVLEAVKKAEEFVAKHTKPKEINENICD